MRALVTILARVGRHGLLLLVPTVRALQRRLQNGGAHGCEMSFDGNPASVVD
jgi:hypothetical protein